MITSSLDDSEECSPVVECSKRSGERIETTATRVFTDNFSRFSRKKIPS